MRTAGEVVQYLNENKCSVYALSLELGLGRSTLRAKLRDAGYADDSEGYWHYKGDTSINFQDIDVVTKKRKVQKKGDSQSSKILENNKKKIDMHDAILKLDLTEERVRTTVSFKKSHLKEMKQLAAFTRFELKDLYTLAITEFLERYAYFMKKGDDIRGDK